MPQRPTWRLDLLAFALFLVGLLVALSTFSHDPEHPVNILGPTGARIGSYLHGRLGIAVYPLLAGWFVLVLTLFIRRRLGTWCRRLAGWLLLVPASALAGHYLGLSVGGGALGAGLADWLEARVVPLGRVLFIVAVLALGGMLAFGFALKAALGRLWRGSCWLGRRCSALLTSRRPPIEPATTRTLPWYRRFRRRRQPALAAPRESAAAVSPPPDTGPLIPIHHAEAAAAPGEGRTDPASLPVVRPGPAPEADRFADFQLPPLTLLDDPQPFPYQEHDQHLRERAALLEKTFKDFDLNVHVVGINTGPVITQYEVALETGLRVHKVTSLVDDLALNLGVPSVRMLAPIPGKNTVGVEIPNEHRAVVRLKDVILAAGKNVARARLPLFLGKDSEGRPLLQDLADMPHLLIAGTTGTGKSVCMNSIILSLLMTRRPDEVKMIMIDPKMLEMDAYGRVPHLMHPVVTQMEKAEAILSWAVDKMDERYDLLKRARVRNLAGYNELSPEEIQRRLAPADDEERRHIPDRMPYIVLFIDEFADLVMRMRKEIEGHIIRLAQKSRAAGIHLVLATQKPTVDVITGLIKSNLPARICFKVASRTDSRVVLDEMGADKLLGRGDMLFLQPGTSNLIRAQGTYASDEEITRVVENLECEPCYDQELVQLKSARSKGNLIDNLRERDELYEEAIEVLVREGRGSVSLLQRALGIGYGRAARLIDFMAEDGIVGDYNGSQAREVLYTPEQWDLLKQNGRRAS